MFGIAIAAPATQISANNQGHVPAPTAPATPPPALCSNALFSPLAAGAATASHEAHSERISRGMTFASMQPPATTPSPVALPDEPGPEYIRQDIALEMEFANELLAHGLDCHVLLLTHVRYVVRRGLYGFGSGQAQRLAWNALA